MLQVLLVLTLELTLLPVLYGFWIDICGLRLTGSSLVSRFMFLEAAPVTWVIVHWLLGMAFLMLTASFVSMLRGLLKPGQLLSSSTPCFALSIAAFLPTGRFVWEVLLYSGLQLPGSQAWPFSRSLPAWYPCCAAWSSHVRLLALPVSMALRSGIRGHASFCHALCLEVA